MVDLAISEARKRANKKWITEKTENITFRVPKGKKTVIQKFAADRGESVNAFINRAVDRAMEEDTLHRIP